MQLKILFRLLVLALLPEYAFATGVGYVSGAVATSAGTAATSVTVTYSPTSGNQVVVGVVNVGTAFSCADNNANALTVLNTISPNLLLAYGTAVSGATSYKCSWTTGHKASAVLAEYSGVVGIGTTNSTGNNGATFAITTVTTKVNSWIVAVFGDLANIASYSSTTGNLRQQETGGAGNSNATVLLDNAGTVIGSSVLCQTTANTSSGTWSAISLELYPTQPKGQAALPLLGVGE